MMHHQYVFATAFAATVWVGCGRSKHDASSAPTFSKLVSFGDSLSDIGSYRVGDVKAVGGGKYTINTAAGPTPQIWTELLAAQLSLPTPCPAQTGLDGTGNNSQMPPIDHTGCFSYAQGGATVTNPIGYGNKKSSFSANPSVGPLTVPVVQQIKHHLAAPGGGFSGSELVVVWAGGNDFFTWFASVGQANQVAAAKASAAGGDTSSAAAAGSAAAAAQLPTAVAGMATAASELAGYIQNDLIGNGARYVVVLSVPDVNSAPFAAAYPGSTQVIAALVNAFNTKLEGAVSNLPQVLYLDLVAPTVDQISRPADFGITNATTPACGATSGLVCTEATTATVAADTSHYFYADAVHPTPYGQALVANLVHQRMHARGWAPNWLMPFPERFQNGAYLPF